MFSRKALSNKLVKQWVRPFSLERLHSFKQYGVKDFQAHKHTSSIASVGMHGNKETPMYGIYSKSALDYELDQSKSGDHSGRQQNHIWSSEEIDERLASIYRHQPVTLADKMMNSLVSIIQFL